MRIDITVVLLKIVQIKFYFYPQNLCLEITCLH